MEEETSIQYDVSGLKDEIMALVDGGSMDASSYEIKSIVPNLDFMTDVEIIAAAEAIGIPMENYQISGRIQK